MKKKFSTKWVGSKLPRKQRKYRANAPFHIRREFMSSNLSKELRKKYGKRSFPLKKGDEVRIMKGEFKKKTGKADKLNLKESKASIEGIYRTKKDGTKIGVYFDASNLQIKTLNLEDKKRLKALERKKGSEKKNKASSNLSKIKTVKSAENKFKKLPKQGEKNVPEKK